MRCSSLLLQPVATFLLAIAFSSPAWGGAAEDQYAVGAGHYAQQRWDLAAEGFREFLRGWAGHELADRVHFFLGETLVQQKDYPAAAEQYRLLVERHPGSQYVRRALFRLGESAYLLGDYPQAGKYLESYTAQYPDGPLGALANYYLGEVALAAGEHQQAARRLTHALQQLPPGPRRQACQLSLARCQIQQGQGSAARKLLASVAEDAQETLADQAAFRLGLLEYRQGRYEDALKAWREFEQRFPDSSLTARVVLGRGWALDRLERFEQAVAELKSIAGNPTLGVEASYWQAMIERKQQHWAQAAETLLAIRPADSHRLAATIHFHAADSLLRAGDYQPAEKQFHLVAQLFGQSKWAAESRFSLILVAAQQDDHNEVVHVASEFIKHHPEQPRAPEAERRRASALMALTRYDKASEAFQRYIAQAPKARDARIARGQLAICLVRCDRDDEAEQVYQEFCQHCSDPQLLLSTTSHLAEAAYARGDYPWANALYQRMSETDVVPELQVKGFAGLAWTKLKMSHPRRAAELFGQLVERFPDSQFAAEALFVRGQIFEQLGEQDPALAMYHRLIAEYADSELVPRALLRAGNLHDSLKQNEQASQYFARLVQDYPDFSQLAAAYYGLAFVESELGNLETSQAAFQKVYEDYPDSRYWADAAYRLAKQAHGQKEYAKAKAVLQKLLASEPGDEMLTHALYLQGRLASEQAHWASVAEPMQKLLALAPESPLCLPAEYAIAEAAFHRRQFDQAGEILGRLVRRVDGRNESWLAMIPLRYAQVLAHQSKWPEAYEVADAIAPRFPDFARQYEVDYVRGRALAARGELNRAREAYEKVIHSPRGAKTETAAMAQWMIGEAYFHQKDYRQARREYLRAEILYAFPRWQAGSLLQAGKCEELLGRWGNASELYERLIEQYPDTMFTAEARKRLRVAQQRAALNLKEGHHAQ